MVDSNAGHSCQYFSLCARYQFGYAEDVVQQLLLSFGGVGQDL